MYKKIGALAIILSFLSLATFAQNDPPPMAMPSEANTALVDKIIAVTRQETYVINYCTQKVKKYAKENHWTADKTNEILKSINFEDFKSDIYNQYAFYTTDQLQKLLDALTLINANPKSGSTMIVTTSMMQSNLDVLVSGIIAGDYIRKK